MSGHQKTQQNARPQKSERASKPEKQTGQKVDPLQMLEAPETMRPEDILAAQQALGNQVVQRAVDKDPKRESATDEQGNLLPELSDTINQSRGEGSPLPGDVQSEAKKSLGRSFKDVRLHTDEQADQISRRISARAFTIGKDIFFKKGAYAPGSSQGRETLIHELTHVVQQSGSKGSSGTLKLGDPGSAMEQQADKLGKKAVQGVTKSSSAQVQRMPAEEEELQMQSEEEEEMLQMESEEEELQMQPVEEEELQMQPVEEEELQMQDDDDDWDTDSEPKGEMTRPSPQEMKMLSSKLVMQMGKQPEKTKQKVNTSPENTETEKPGSRLESMPPQARLKIMLNQKDMAKKGKESALKEVKGKSEDMNLGSEDHMKRLNALEERNQKHVKSFYNAEQKAGTSGFLNQSIAKKKTEEEAQTKEKSVNDTKAKWMNTLRDPNASSADIEKAKKRLQTLHKDSVSDKEFEEANKQRKAALEEAAKSGDDKAFERMESEKTAEEEEKKKNPSKAKKFGGFMKKAGLGLAKGIGGMIADQGKDGLKHFLGVDTGKDDDDDDEKEEKKGKKGGKPAKGGGGDGGSAVGTIMEKYAEVVEENKKLKAMLEKKEA
jgi:hypothetical protein